MTPQEAIQKLLPIATATHTELQKIGLHHSCIFAGAVLTEILHRSGYPAAYPVTIRGFILNPELREWAIANDFNISDETEAEWRQLGGRLVDFAAGPVTPENEEKWHGHLGVVIPHYFGDRNALLDLTIPQINNSEWKIVLPSITTLVSDEFVRGEDEYRMNVNASLIIYTADPNDKSYMDTPLWKDESRYKELGSRIADRLK